MLTTNNYPSGNVVRLQITHNILMNNFKFIVNKKSDIFDEYHS